MFFEGVEIDGIEGMEDILGTVGDVGIDGIEGIAGTEDDCGVRSDALRKNVPAKRKVLHGCKSFLHVF